MPNGRRRAEDFEAAYRCGMYNNDAGGSSSMLYDAQRTTLPNHNL